MTITSQGFGFKIEVTAKVAKLCCAMYEGPISYTAGRIRKGRK